MVVLDIAQNDLRASFWINVGFIIRQLFLADRFPL
jgi:hypothetical protein